MTCYFRLKCEGNDNIKRWVYPVPPKYRDDSNTNWVIESKPCCVLCIDEVDKEWDALMDAIEAAK